MLRHPLPTLLALVPLSLAIASLAPVHAQSLVLDGGLLGVDDFEITPDGRYAVGRENRVQTAAWIVDLTTGTVAANPQGSLIPGDSGPAIDAVAVTNDRAVVLGNSAMLLDLTNLAAPILADIVVGSTPRDLAITPDGSKVVVRGGSGPNGGQFVIDLAFGGVLASHLGNIPPPYPNPQGVYSFDVDSVAVTDSHAVLTSYVNSDQGPGTRVTLWELNGLGGPVVAFETTTADDLAGGPHDVAITPDGTKAVVRAERELAVYDLTVSPPALLFRRSPTGTLNSFGDFTLDSLLATDTHAITIGRLGSSNTRVFVYDMSGATGTDDLIGLPHDLALTPDGSRFVVRTGAGVGLYALASFASPDFPPADLAPAQGAGTGIFAGMDSVAAGDEFAVTLTQVPGVATIEARIWNIASGQLSLVETASLPETRPLDLALTPDGERVVVSGTNSVSVVHLASGAVTYYGKRTNADNWYPWCDGVVTNDEHAVAFGYFGAMSGWFRVLDLRVFGPNYCTANANSTGAAAEVRAYGSPSLSNNDLVLAAENLPEKTFGVFFYSPTASQAATPFGDGFWCVGPLRFRLPAFVSSNSGGAALQVDLTNLPAGGQITAGPAWNFQLAYRNPPGGPAGFNTSNALSIVFGP